ncbi:TRAP transporter substrate-binding protein [candidate division KSB1 bacterium]
MDRKFYCILPVLFVLLAACGRASEEVTVIKLAHGLDTNHPVHKGMVYMSEKVEEKSEGKMRVEIFPNGQLGSERELIELVQIGLISITKVSSAVLENFVPKLKVFSIPYVFRDYEHRWKVLQGDIGKQILLSGEQFLIRGLCYYDAGSRSFYTKDFPILEPEDLSGLKVRVMKSQTSIQTIQALGGSSTPISWGELYSALQQGIVDAAENNPPSFFYSRHYELCKYYSIDEHTSPPDVLLISTHTWNKLSEEQKNILQAAVDESVEYQKQLWKETEQQILDELKSSGVEIHYPDKEKFRQAVKSVYESYKGTEIYRIIEEVQAIK